MSYECIKVDVADGLARVSINRPDKLNALNIRTICELIESFTALRDDGSVRVVVLTGEGGKSFAAGADIPELREQGLLGGKTFSERGHRLCNLIENLGKPVIAAVNGFALGGGCEIAMACTVRIASDKAKLGQPEITLGTIPGYGGTVRLSRLVPRGLAMELMLTGRIIGAEEALRIGLVNKVVAHDDLEAETSKLAALLMSKPPFALKAVMEAVLHGTEIAFEEGCRLEQDLFAMTCGTEDFREGMSAFIEKREAKFTGR
ncbi:MAG: enoyl-CoA hydratase-related protein [Candidatus Krumholzibacteria bacterium]|nr:enoyl-CoA hydratase-related protein [Candidatus Krumholzibacteria bacterium]